MANIMSDKEYNTHLIKLWLDNEVNNYNSQKSITSETFNDDKKLIGFLKDRNYEGDRKHIRFNKKDIDLNSIRETIRDNQDNIKFPTL